MMTRNAFVAVVCVIVAIQPALAQQKLTPTDVGVLVAKDMTALKGQKVDDAIFLRRATLDLVGRPPGMAEQDEYMSDKSPDKRKKLVDRLLASPDFGTHWGNIWSDAIASRVPPPELTFLNYKWFKEWFAEQLNKGEPWDKIVRDILTAEGNIKTSPAVTFIGYHQGRANKLAAETARVFLGVQLQCAECHDHKTEEWSRENFHGLAAFFARSSGKLGKEQDGGSTTVADSGKGEHVMLDVINPKKPGKTMAPVLFTGEKLAVGVSDKERRKLLAESITRPDHPLFARAYVNRVWARLVGRGFCEPVDNMGETNDWVLKDVHKALADHFVASKFDIKDLFRLIMSSDVYQMDHTLGEVLAEKSQTIHNDLTADEIFRQLQLAIGLQNVTPPAKKPTAEVRFPPPPLSTRDIIACKFCFDPSLAPEEVSRTMGQAMLLMNNQQIQAAINADPKSGTQLSKLLQEHKDNRVALTKVFQHVLSRQPREQELTIGLDYINEVGNRGEAFEDIVWSLINSAEFTTKR